VAALNKHPDRASADAIRLLLLTGARRGEILSMRWLDIDLDSGTWSRKALTLKQDRDHAIPLSDAALALLHSIRDQQIGGRSGQGLGTYVFPSATSESKHLVAIRKLWRNILKEAELRNFRIHDLRHSFASQLVSTGASLELISSLLGHADVKTTQRYSHLYDSVERTAVDRIGAWIEAAGQPEPPKPPETPALSGQVVKFPRGSRKTS
jgi:integrase